MPEFKDEDFYLIGFIEELTSALKYATKENIKKIIDLKRGEIKEDVRLLAVERNKAYENEKPWPLTLQVRLNKLVRADWLCVLTEEMLKEQKDTNACLHALSVVMSAPHKEELDQIRKYVESLSSKFN
jgi:hypothetical protein